MVPQSYAVIDPLTVVVKPVRTRVTDVTMSRVTRTQDPACRTQLVRMTLLQHFEEGYLGGGGNIAWVGQCCEGKEEIRDEKEGS